MNAITHPMPESTQAQLLTLAKAVAESHLHYQVSQHTREGFFDAYCLHCCRGIPPQHLNDEEVFEAKEHEELSDALTRAYALVKHHPSCPVPLAKALTATPWQNPWPTLELIASTLGNAKSVCEDLLIADEKFTLNTLELIAKQHEVALNLACKQCSKTDLMQALAALRSQLKGYEAIDYVTDAQTQCSNLLENLTA